MIYFENRLLIFVSDQVSNLVKGLSATGFVKDDLSLGYSQTLLREVLRIWNRMNAIESTMTIDG
jgi:hypothetical protein